MRTVINLFRESHKPGSSIGGKTLIDVNIIRVRQVIARFDAVCITGLSSQPKSRIHQACNDDLSRGPTAGGVARCGSNSNCETMRLLICSMVLGSVLL